MEWKQRGKQYSISTQQVHMIASTNNHEIQSGSVTVQELNSKDAGGAMAGRLTPIRYTKWSPS